MHLIRYIFLFLQTQRANADLEAARNERIAAEEKSHAKRSLLHALEEERAAEEKVAYEERRSSEVSVLKLKP